MNCYSYYAGDNVIEMIVLLPVFRWSEKWG